MNNKILSLSAVLAIAASSLVATNTPSMKSCMGCHGKQFQKSAFGKSKIVKDFSKKEITTALKGYKDGTYGGSMKGIMKGQVGKYSDKQLDEIATNVYGLNHKTFKNTNGSELVGSSLKNYNKGRQKFLNK